MGHIFGAIGGGVLAILGVFALGAYLANSRAGRLGLAAMEMTVVGQVLSLVIGGVSTFASNALGRVPGTRRPRPPRSATFECAQYEGVGLRVEIEAPRGSCHLG